MSNFSCFISYAHLDDAFATKLHSDLQTHNILCWKDDIDLKGGDYWQRQIDQAIRQHDKVIIICSNQSLIRPQVAREIIEGMELQRELDNLKLFPIRIDDYIFSNEFMEFSKKQVEEGEWEVNFVSKLRAFHIPDFSGWMDYGKYKNELDRLIDNLTRGV